MNARTIIICKDGSCDSSAHRLDGGTGRYCDKHKLEDRPSERIKKTHHRKNRLIRKNGWVCSQCHRKTWQGKQIPLQIDHIDGDRNNNVESNLRILCVNCHAQTDTFCGKNKGRYLTHSSTG